jgi:hypothetical protein
MADKLSKSGAQNAYGDQKDIKKSNSKSKFIASRNDNKLISNSHQMGKKS